MSDLYSAMVLDHVNSPRNVVSLDDANVVVQAADPSCGDGIVFFRTVVIFLTIYRMIAGGRHACLSA
jgi:NifU-like protein involved in Fe-S cluster formation